MFPTLSYYLHRFSARLHRTRLALHARGWRGLLARATGGAHMEAGHHTQTSAAPPFPSGDARILIIDVTTPRPDRDSGSMRARGLMSLLLEMGYQVDFLPDDGRHAGTYTEDLRETGITVHFVRGLARLRWLQANARHYTTVIVSRYHLAEALFPLLRSVAPSTVRILDTVDLHHLREFRESRQRDDGTLEKLAERTRRRELAMIGMADATWVVSDVERELLSDALPGAAVYVISNVHDILPAGPGPSERKGAVFVGGAGHPPNVDAVEWLVGTLFPLMRRSLPDLVLHLVGDGWRERVTNPPQGVVVHGYVSDIDSLLARVRVGLAPLRFGAGVKGKVNLGMAHGLPMVVTGCAAEGMHLVDGEHAFLADSPSAIAAAVVAACTDDALWIRVSKAARAHVDRHFSRSVARRAIAASLPPPHARSS